MSVPGDRDNQIDLDDGLSWKRGDTHDGTGWWRVTEACCESAVDNLPIVYVGQIHACSDRVAEARARRVAEGVQPI